MLRKFLLLFLFFGVIRSCQPTHAENADVKTRIAVAMAMSQPTAKKGERVSKYLPASLPAGKGVKDCGCQDGGPCRCGASCSCDGCPYHTSYRAARAKAIEKKLPLLIFVGYRKIPHVPEVVSVSVPSLEGAEAPSVVVGIPDGTGDIDRVADLTGYPSVDTIIAKLSRKKSMPGVPSDSCSNGSCCNGSCGKNGSSARTVQATQSAPSIPSPPPIPFQGSPLGYPLQGFGGPMMGGFGGGFGGFGGGCSGGG